jgi:hypothetical protein
MELTTEAHISSLLNGIFGVHYFNPGFWLERERERVFQIQELMKKSLPDLEQCHQLIRFLFPDLPRQKKEGEIRNYLNFFQKYWNFQIQIQIQNNIIVKESIESSIIFSFLK